MEKYSIKIDTMDGVEHVYLSITRGGILKYIKINNPDMEIPLIISALQRHLHQTKEEA